MAKQVISPEEFISEVNRRLPAHHGYKAGMRAFLVLIGADGKNASGYDWEPSDLATVGVIADVSASVESEFAVNPYISRNTRP